MTSELNQLISDELDVGKRDILKKLKPLCKFAYVFMGGFGKNWKAKYRRLQATKQWKQARLLLKEYFTTKGVLTCPECGLEIKDNESFTLHHKDFYPKNPYSLFSPLFTSIIHTKCHKRGDPRKW